MLYVMEVDGRGFPSSDLTNNACPIGENTFESPSLKIARKSLTSVVSVSLLVSS